jgi:hypothetical protein
VSLASAEHLVKPGSGFMFSFMGSRAAGFIRRPQIYPFYFVAATAQQGIGTEGFAAQA